MKSIKLFCLIISFAFCLNAFSDPQKIFPIPKGFTADSTKALKVNVYIPPKVERAHISRTKKALGLFLDNYGVCKSLKIGRVRVHINKVRYYLKASASGIINTYTSKKGVYGIICPFRWYFKKGTRYVLDSSAPVLYIKNTK